MDRDPRAAPWKNPALSVASTSIVNILKINNIPLALQGLPSLESSLDTVIKFAAFEVDTQTGELRKHGVRLKLADQPFRVLITLLERPGDLITREELKQRLWAGEEFGDFEQGLNRIVSKLRDVLGDRASQSRFIETLPGRGYRFVCPIDRPVSSTQQTDANIPKRRRWLLIAASALVLLLVVSCAAWLFVPPRVQTLRWRKLTTDNLQKSPPVLTDGTRIYFLASISGEQSLLQVPLDGGQPVRLPVTLPGPYAALQDISADGQELLLTASGAAAERRNRLRPLWALRIADGSARRIGAILATSATYEPKTGMIVYTSGSQLRISPANGIDPRKLLEMKGKLLDSVAVAPDSRQIRFAARDAVSGASSAWAVRIDGTGLSEIFPDWNRDHSPMGWSADGRIGLFGGGGMIWGYPEPHVSLFRTRQQPIPLLTDSPEFLQTAHVRSASVFHVIGTDRLAELQRYDPGKQVWISLLDGLSANAAEYSRDGQRLAYVAYPQGTLWVRQADGSQPIQLTSPPDSVASPRWSPDGRRLAFNAQEGTNKPFRLFVVDSSGGVARPVVSSEQSSQGYSSWSPDGEKLVYGVGDRDANGPVIIRMVEVSSGKVSKLDGSDGLYAPRWSPDGKVIAAQQRLAPGHLMLYTVADRRWDEVAGGSTDWPAWEPDSKSILFQSGRALMRYGIDSRRLSQVTEIEPAAAGNGSHGVGVMPDGAPIRTLNRDSRQIYELRFENR
jgi:Tol biopolymer transport system component/DNA-binding winged helix-turn-helix (wHTH) protein